MTALRPWHIGRKAGEVRDARGRIVADCHEYRGSSGSNYAPSGANAHLIVRAVNSRDELLEAASNVLDKFRRTDTHLTHEQKMALTRLLRAEAKAEGRET